MNLNILCVATISKRLRKICQDNPLFLSIQPLNDGRMVARLKISCPDDVKVDDVKKIEDISIMLEVDDVSEDVKDLGDETPIQNLYAAEERIENSKLAITEPNSELKKYEKVEKVASAEKVETQKETIFPKAKPASKNFISNYDDLMKILSAIPDIDQVVPQVPVNHKMSRQEAIEFGKAMQSVPKLPLGTYISNETGSRICIDDLNLMLTVNEITDLSSIPAQKIKNSRQLQSCFERGYIKFRSKGEYNEWCKGKESVGKNGDEKVTIKILDKKVEDYEMDETLDDSSGNTSDSSKSRVFTDDEIRSKKAAVCTAAKTSAIKSNAIIDENASMEVTGEEPTEGEKELSEIIKDLPKEKEKDIEVDANEPDKTPLLSDQVEKQEKNKIRRKD